LWRTPAFQTGAAITRRSIGSCAAGCAAPCRVCDALGSARTIRYRAQLEFNRWIEIASGEDDARSRCEPWRCDRHELGCRGMKEKAPRNERTGAIRLITHTIIFAQLRRADRSRGAGGQPAGELA
jgi:hypothetical protein